MKNRKSKLESGQAIVLLALGMVVMLGFTALAIDGGMVYADKRHAQNAADAASLAGAGAAATYMEANGINSDNFSCSSFVSGSNDMGSTQAAINRAASNGYTIAADFSGSNNVEAECVNSGDDQYIKIATNITRTTNTSLIHFVYSGDVEEQAEAVARVEPPGPTSLFFGNAVVGLNPEVTDKDHEAAIYLQGSSQSDIKGGGMFANNDAVDKHGSVTFEGSYCVTAVDEVQGFTCGGSGGNTDLYFDYPTDIEPLLPPIPDCTADANRIDDGSGTITWQDTGVTDEGSKVPAFDSGADHVFESGLYCLTDLGGNTSFQGTITGTDVTFYIVDEDFTFKYTSNSGSITATAPTTGTYANMLMFSHITSTDPESQVFKFRGNGSESSTGTIFLPSALIDLKGNSNGVYDNTQVIGYSVEASGNSQFWVNYNADDNYQIYTPPKLNLQH
jgi:hypothetical protein